MNSAEVFRLIGFTLTIFIEGWRCDDVVNDHIVPFEGTLEKGYPQSNLDQSFPSPRIDAKEIHQILHSTAHVHLSLSLSLFSALTLLCLQQTNSSEMNLAMA